MRTRILLFAAMLLGCVSLHAQTIVYNVSLNGLNESPPVATLGVGVGSVTVNLTNKTMRVRVLFGNLSGNTTACHIHAATATANTGTAGVATTTPTFAGFPSGVTSGNFDQTYDMTLASSYRAAYITANGNTTLTAFAALTTAMAEGKAYLNIHTSFAPGGEIRGFLTPCSPTGSTRDTVVCASALPVTWDGLTFNAAGTQTRTISGGNSQGCDSIIAYSLAVSQASIGSITSSSPTACVNGTLTLTANGVTGKNADVTWYTQANGGGTYVGNGLSVTTNLGPRTYHAMVMTDCGEMIEDSIIIPQTLSATWTSTNATCFGGTGSINNIVVSGGSSPYQVSTKVNSGFTNTTSISNLSAAPYRIFFQDNTGCLGFSNIIRITQPAKIATTFTKNDASCFGSATGSLTNISSTGGNGGFTYSLNPASPYNAVTSFNNLRASTYRIYTKDAAGCSAFTDKIVVGQAPAITFTTSKVNSDCPAANNGSITVVASGGTGALTYRNGPAGTPQSSGTFSNLKAGNYRIFITDANNCTVFTNIIAIINANSACSSFARSTPVIEQGSESTTLSVYPNPAKGQFKLQLNARKAGVATVTITNQNGAVVSNRMVNLMASQNLIAVDASRLAPGTYFAKVVTNEGIQVTKVVVQ